MIVSPKVYQENVHIGEAVYWATLLPDEGKVKQIQLGVQSALNPENLVIKKVQIQQVREKITSAETMKEAKIHGKTVHFSVHEKPGKNLEKNLPYMRISVEIMELTAVLGISKEAVKEAVKNGSFNELITNCLAKELVSENSQVRVLKGNEKKEKKIPDQQKPDKFQFRNLPLKKNWASENGQARVLKGDEKKEKKTPDQQKPDKLQFRNLPSKMDWGIDKGKSKHSERPDSSEAPFQPDKVRLVKTQETLQTATVVCKKPNWKHPLSEKEYENIKSFYENNIKDLNGLTEPIHIRKGIKQPKGYPGQLELPCSLVFIPYGPQKGLHVLLKTHRKMEELGRGSYNEVTAALHMDSGEEKAFRDARAEHVPKGELEANKELSGDPKRYVAAWPPIPYKGPYRNRNRDQYATKNDMPRDLDVDKIGFICDVIPMNLQAKLKSLPPVSSAKKSRIPIERLQIALAYTKLIANLAERGLVHCDQKNGNTAIGSDGRLKLLDFGMTVKVGSERNCCGTSGYIAPELLEADVTGQRGIRIKADSKMDVWSMGCVLANICGSELVHELKKHDRYKGELLEYLRSKNFEKMKQRCLPHRKDPDHIHSIIDKCLSLHSDDRPHAQTVTEFIEKRLPYEGTY
jgi:uncharacterized protein YggU (UPF0235/DUF167 family)